MELFGKKISKESFINPNIRVLLLPLFTLLVMGFLVITVVRIAMPRIKSENEKLKLVKDSIVKLEQKLEILRQVQDKVLGYADTSLVAMPDEDSVLWKLSQLKAIASENDTTIVKQDVNLQDYSVQGLNGTGISINASGNFEKSLNFVKDIMDSSPISNIKSLGLERNGDGLLVKFSVSTYNSPLPTKLPKISEPIKNLTVKEQALLDELAKLKKPEFTILDPTGPYNRQDPFN